ncbi:MAG: hypothetical protein WCK10_03920 [Candidatus Staskawiczbacteria bacterium]
MSKIICIKGCDEDLGPGFLTPGKIYDVIEYRKFSNKLYAIIHRCTLAIKA